MREREVTAQALLRDMLRLQVAPVLRGHGYTGSGQDFHRLIDGNWVALNVQRNRYSTAEEVTFTINLGTASTAARTADGYRPAEPVPEVECHWRCRIGELLPGGQDHWWTVGSARPTQVQALGEEVASQLVTRALPKLAAMAPDEAILAAHLDGEPAPGMSLAAMDVVGPILQRIGPAEKFERYLETIEPEGDYAASLYASRFGPAALGPARVAKRLESLSAKGFERRLQAVLDLGFAAPSDALKSAIRPLLEDANRYIRAAAAESAGRLGDTDAVPRLLDMVRREPARYAALHAAFGLGRMDDRLATTQRSMIRSVIAERRKGAVGHDRPALAELLRRVGPL